MDNLEIVIVSAGMPFGPDTLLTKSLGGSETAALSLAKELKVLGHIVTVFTNLPAEGEADYIRSGSIGDDAVRYVAMDNYGPFISSTEVDLLIVSRSPELLKLNHQARRAVLWVHDLATYNGPSKIIADAAYNIDEVWAVSDWHADQYAKVTGYPRERVKTLRNAITRQPVMDFVPRSANQLFYAARPERGMEALVRPGGIMSRLPSYQLKMSMYNNVADQMKPYYGQLFAWAQALPNVEFLGMLNQAEVRQLMRDSAAYVYPTNHEETSCILAREAMEQGCPFLYRDRGALKETLLDAGIEVVSQHPYNSDEFCADWAEFIASAVGPGLAAEMAPMMPEPRYWNEAAADVVEAFYAMNGMPPQPFSLVRSLVEDSDIIPAIAYLKASLAPDSSEPLRDLAAQIEALYPYLYGRETFADYYERYFLREDTKGARVHRSMEGNPRFEAIAAEVAELADESTVLDYGCAEGVIILDLAKRFPNKRFVGIDFAASNVELCRKYADELGLTNTSFYHGSTENWPAYAPLADAVICSEVLEHVTEPWQVIGYLEEKIKVGGRVITTVPMGSWEATGLYDKKQFPWRAHIWHINKWMLRQMFADKKECRMSSMPGGATADGRAIGHLTFSYEADHVAPHPVDPLDKAFRHRMRESVTATMIVNNADMLMRTLKSIHRQVGVIKIDVNSADLDVQNDVANVVDRFRADHPWVFTYLTVGRELRPNEWGFDDARNAVTEGVATDWALWIDSDEYLSGDLTRYLRPNAFDSYSIHQHHFTCDPRGAPSQLDKPARLYRTDRGFKFFGKVHEHAEKGLNGGPGFCMVLPDVDIGHVGYSNENVRRDRFNRNFPYLEWDHRVNPDRNLSKFLWLRDIVQRMRYFAEQGDMNQARLLAEDGVAYYAKEWKEWDAPGMGGEQALHYYSEAMGFLGRGQPVQLQMDTGDDKGVIAGVFESEDDVARLVKATLKGRFDQRRSGYLM